MLCMCTQYGVCCMCSTCVYFILWLYFSLRCFTFGIGSGASTALVEGLARAGNGSAEFVKEGERLQPKVQYFQSSLVCHNSTFYGNCFTIVVTVWLITCDYMHNYCYSTLGDSQSEASLATCPDRCEYGIQN